MNTPRILVVDDDPDTIAATLFALDGFHYGGLPVEFHTAASAEEARQVLMREGRFSVALLDVVMEDRHAGLELIQWIRSSLQDTELRIVLRTGQPGDAPEERVARNYDIDAYLPKSETSATRLRSTLLGALRVHESMAALSAQFSSASTRLHRIEQELNAQALSIEELVGRVKAILEERQSAA